MKIFRVILIALAFVVGTAGFASAEYLPSNRTQADQVDSLALMVEYLGEKSYIPSRLELRKISPDVVADLVTIAEGRYAKKLRNRAIQSLALYRSDQRAIETIDSLMSKLGPGHSLFPGLVVAYAHVYGEDSFATIEAFATHPRRDVRMAAVVALGRFGGQAGYEKLKAIAADEEHPAIRERIEGYIQ